MKKTYINPEMQVVKINAPQLLAGSETMNTNGNYDSGSITIGSREADFDLDDDF